MGAAQEWCDEAMLDKIEGIWEFPDDHTKVLICRSQYDKSLYDVIVVEAEDVRLIPGENIGYLKKSATQDKFEMGLFRGRNKKGILAELGKCFAQYDDKNNALLVKGRSIKLSIGSRWLLPAFWRLIKVSVKDPLESLPKGLVKIYPVNHKMQPDYL